jgi:hypothetical protein
VAALTDAANEAFNARHILGATIAWGGGKVYNFVEPNPEIITLEDMAYALAYTVRWRGQARHECRRVFYGVGQHVVFGAEEMLAAGHSPEDALGFLFHEPDEVVLPDMPGPVKPLLPGFRELAKAQGAALLERFGVRIANPTLCKRWDLRMMVTEKRDLMAGHEGHYFQTSYHELIPDGEFQPFERRIVPYAHPDEAAHRFLELCDQLGIAA